MEYFVVLTICKQFQAGSVAHSTMAQVATFRPGTTMAELYGWAINQLPPEMRGGNTLHFSATPNKVGAA